MINIIYAKLNSKPSFDKKISVLRKFFSQKNFFPKGKFSPRSLKSVPMLRERDWEQLLWMGNGGAAVAALWLITDIKDIRQSVADYEPNPSRKRLQMIASLRAESY